MLELIAVGLLGCVVFLLAGGWPQSKKLDGLRLLIDWKAEFFISLVGAYFYTVYLSCGATSFPLAGKILELFCFSNKWSPVFILLYCESLVVNTPAAPCEVGI